MKKYILFGAARQGFEYYSEHKQDSIYCFFDNNPSKWGTKHEGISILKPVYLGEDYHVIIANDKHDIDMVNQILELGYKHFSVIYPKGQNVGNDAFGLDTFDYSKYVNFDVDDRKVVLLANTTSGSNSWCFKYYVENVIKDKTFKMTILETRKKTHNFYYEIFTAKFIALTSSFTSIKNKVIIQFFHGLPLKRIGYMDKFVTDTSFELTHKDMINANYILSYSRFYSVVFGSCFGVPSNKYLEIGVPRNDVLLSSDGRNKIAKLFPQTIGKRMLLYMPTYRERTLYSDNDTKGYIFMYPDFNLKQFSSFLEDNGLVLLIKMHVEDTKRFSSFSANCKNIIFLTDDYFENEDFYGYINGTDYLITDYSSIYFDYLLLNKPVFFAHLDIEKYEQERGLMFENMDFWCAGHSFKTIIDFENALINVMSGNDEYKEKRLLLKKMIHSSYNCDSSVKLLSVMKGCLYEK